jgi:hypothetical protein
MKAYVSGASLEAPDLVRSNVNPTHANARNPLIVLLGALLTN